MSEIVIGEYGGMVRLEILVDADCRRVVHLTDREWAVLRENIGPYLTEPAKVDWCEPGADSKAENGHVRSLEPEFANKAES